MVADAEAIERRHAGFRIELAALQPRLQDPQVRLALARTDRALESQWRMAMLPRA
jgi:hypothetical protein